MLNVPGQLDSGAPRFFLPHLLRASAATCEVPPEPSPARLPTVSSECVFRTGARCALKSQTTLNLLVSRLSISGAAPQMLNVSLSVLVK